MNLGEMLELTIKQLTREAGTIRHPDILQVELWAAIEKLKIAKTTYDRRNGTLMEYWRSGPLFPG